MNRRTLCVLVALFSSSTIAACGASEDGAVSQPAAVALSGVYRPVGKGAIGVITFSGSKDDYLLMPTGCANEACAEIGTYRLDAANHVILLENVATKRTRSITLEILKTTATRASLVQSVAPLDLVDPGTQLERPGQQTTTGGGQQLAGNGQQLATGGNQLSGVASQLLQIIQQAIMNGQQMQQDNKGADAPAAPAPAAPAAPANADPKNDCKQGIPTKDTPLAEVAAYFARCPNGP